MNAEQPIQVARYDDGAIWYMDHATRLPIGTATFPNSCGVYVVYSDDHCVQPLYIGKAATQTIRRRWERQHLVPRSGGSALRRSLAVHLGLVAQKLKRPSRYYPDEIESAISDHLKRCYIRFEIRSTGADATRLEQREIRRLRPILNVLHRIE